MYELLLCRQDNCSLEFQGSLKLTLKFKVHSRSRGPAQKVSRVFKVEGNQKISRGKSSWSWKTLNFKARMRVHISRELHIKARVERFEISRYFQGISRNPWNPSVWFLKEEEIQNIYKDIVTLGARYPMYHSWSWSSFGTGATSAKAPVVFEQ